MITFIKVYLPWILSVITIYTMVLAGNKHPKTWILGLLNQFVWLTWIVGTMSWGFLPMNIAFFVVYYRNHVKWSKTMNVETVRTEQYVQVTGCKMEDDKSVIPFVSDEEAQFYGIYLGQPGNFVHHSDHPVKTVAMAKANDIIKAGTAKLLDDKTFSLSSNS